MAVGRMLTARELNRALLARQLLLQRSRLSLARTLESIGGIQNQYAPSGYIGLWKRLDGFALGDLTRALERRHVVQGTLMRSTIHLVSPRDYWLFSAGVGPSRQEHWLNTNGKQFRDADLDAMAATVRRELAGGVRPRDEVDALLRSHGSSVWGGAWVELIRVPPSGTWERRRADLFQLASEWLKPAVAPRSRASSTCFADTCTPSARGESTMPPSGREWRRPRCAQPPSG